MLRWVVYIIITALYKIQKVIHKTVGFLCTLRCHPIVCDMHVHGLHGIVFITYRLAVFKYLYNS